MKLKLHEHIKHQLSECTFTVEEMIWQAIPFVQDPKIILLNPFSEAT